MAAAASLAAVASPTGDRKHRKDKQHRVAVVVDEKPVAKKSAASSSPMRDVSLTDARTQLSGTWVVTEVRRKPLKGGLHVRLDIDMKTGRVAGDMGCNLVNARIKVAGTQVTFSDVVTTHHSCADASSEQAVVKAFGDSHSLRLETNGRVTMLHTVSSHGSTVLSLRRVDLATIDGVWQLTSLYGESVSGMRMVLDATAEMFHAEDAHIINGVTRVDAAVVRSLQFEDLHATDEDVELTDTEQRLMLALEEVTGYDIDHQGVMSLHDEEDHVVATLRRTSL